VVEVRAVGLVAEPTHAEPVPAVRKPTRAALERRIEELEGENAQLHGG